MIKLLSNVKKQGLQPPMWYALGVIQILMAPEDCIVTSMLDGQHHDGSLHALGLAVDLRSHHLTESNKDRVLSAAKSLLFPQGFDFIIEDRGKLNEHFHVEYDPKPDVGRTLIFV